MRFPEDMSPMILLPELLLLLPPARKITTFEHSLQTHYLVDLHHLVIQLFLLKPGYRKGSEEQASNLLLSRHVSKAFWHLRSTLQPTESSGTCSVANSSTEGAMSSVSLTATRPPSGSPRHAHTRPKTHCGKIGAPSMAYQTHLPRQQRHHCFRCCCCCCRCCW